ncbi:CDP-alcohol phosphatidyltransferase family protein [Sphingomonas sp. LY54]|uniref:CDP-alcohol phosphatidyltransferase family protein n=1 Tax=Sphingomonas sp. LY54 TaxID=3095343 RepID=UPI002D78B8F8|nr:CDP-alcohol phosphatidyltransferase family protein [Sphingomonas sp. LY54]WRP27755.1 CDP-alcohol phosphatidyltransferase family protein [Sphingomonas sp. LY54]
MAVSIELPVSVVGQNQTLFWGMPPAERVRRIADMYGLPIEPGPHRNAPVLLVSAYMVFDPAWLRSFAEHPGEMLTVGGVPAIAHCRSAGERAAVEAAMLGGRPASADCGLTAIAHESGATMVNQQLRKREHPFALAFDASTVRRAERASYYGAYKGVTDLLTKYLWPEWALVLTRLAARWGITPNMVTMAGAFLCILAAILFALGHYWAGMAAGLGFMVLDTVDGKLARCTITSSKWGNLFDHGIDQIHPPFWWYAWGVGLAAYGRPLPPDAFAIVMVAIIGGYLLQRVIEGVFMRMFGMHIHVWRELDSRFRLITARRNPNMVILFVATLLGRPDTGLVAVACWTLVSCLFHGARLAQALALRGRGQAIRSWLG